MPLLFAGNELGQGAVPPHVVAGVDNLVQGHSRGEKPSFLCHGVLPFVGASMVAENRPCKRPVFGRVLGVIWVGNGQKEAAPVRGRSLIFRALNLPNKNAL